MTKAHIDRRSKLLSALGGRRALIFAGRASPRNYLANPYTFRASSHFLYLVGKPISGAMLFASGSELTLLIDDHDPSDALWHGETPGASELGRELGIEVRHRSDLGVLLGDPSDVATLGVMDGATRLEQSAIFARAIRPGISDPRDEVLADAMIALRRRHDEAAVAEIRSAVAITERAHAAGMRATRAGIKEHVVRAAMEAEMLAAGTEPAYGSIVTTRGDVLHMKTFENDVRDGDMILADVGSESLGNFASDVTRVWPVAKTFAGEQRAIYELTLAANVACIDATRAGVRYRDIHMLACRVIAEGLVALGLLRGNVDELVADGVHAMFFAHGVGHLLGLDVHDMEDLGDRPAYASGRTRSRQFGLAYLRLDRDLEPGMVVTIEPGIYFARTILEDAALRATARDRFVASEVERFAGRVRGVRIEDDVLVTASGAPDVLTARIPKTVDAVEAQRK